MRIRFRRSQRMGGLISKTAVFSLEARVELTSSGLPQRVFATGIWGAVVQAAGPWRASGEWWTNDEIWSREEWDVALNDGAVYRLYASGDPRRWYLEGTYD